VHFLKRVLERRNGGSLLRLRALYFLLYVSLVALPLASRPKARAFDRIGTLELARAYAEQLALLFSAEPELGLAPPRWLLTLLGARRLEQLSANTPPPSSIEAAERAVERASVTVTAL
jgi:hypothetical protein